MRTFNTPFTTEKNKRADGPQPINLLEFGFTAPLRLSDRDVTPSGGSAYSGLVKSWGFIDSDLGQMSGGSIIGAISVPDLTLTLINSQQPRVSDSFVADQPLEATTVTLYQWFGGLTSAQKEPLFVGLVTGQPEYDEYECRLTLRGIWQRYNIEIGADRIITAASYPAADPDDIGQMMSICYGQINKAPCRCVASGAVDFLLADIDATQVSIELSDASRFPTSGHVGVDGESIAYTGKTGNILTGCTRGYGDTVGTIHAKGKSVWDQDASFVYQVAGHPVNQIDDVYIDGVRVTTVVTKYSGQTGQELAGYAGQAVIFVPGRLTRQQVIDLILDTSNLTIATDLAASKNTLDVNNGLSYNAGSIAVDASGLTSSSSGMTAPSTQQVAAAALSFIDNLSPAMATATIAEAVTLANGTAVTTQPTVGTGSHAHDSAQETISWYFDQVYEGVHMFNQAFVIDKNFDTGAWRDSGWATSAATASLRKLSQESHPGPPQQFRLRMLTGNNVGSVLIQFIFGGHNISRYVGNEDLSSDWFDVTSAQNTWEEFMALEGAIYIGARDSTWGENSIMAVWVEVKFTPATNSSAATGVAINNSTTVGGNVTFNSRTVTPGTIAHNGTGGIGVGANSLSGGVTISGNPTIGGKSSVSATAQPPTTNGAVSLNGTPSLTGSRSIVGAAQLNGNSVADVVIGKLLTANVRGWQDDASGTYTGTANALIERPNHVFKHLWVSYLAAPVADFDASSSSSYFAAQGYTFSLLLDKPVQAAALFSRLALQCRSRFAMMPSGKAKLLLRQLQGPSTHAIIKEEIKADSMRIARSSIANLVNDLTIYYDPDRTRGAVSADTCQAAQRHVAGTSIARYGRHTADRTLFTFDAVRADAMVTDVLQFYLAWLKIVRRMPQFAVFLDNLEIEPGDTIDLTHPLDNMIKYPCEVLKTQHVLGDRGTVDHVIVWAIENGARE